MFAWNAGGNAEVQHRAIARERANIFYSAVILTQAGMTGRCGPNSRRASRGLRVAIVMREIKWSIASFSAAQE